MNHIIQLAINKAIKENELAKKYIQKICYFKTFRD